MVRSVAGRFLLDQWMADQGYIVVSIDGRGTPGRGRDWSRAIKHDLIELPLKDQVSALRLLGEKYSELDMSRVGMHGWSFGGYFTAMALMRHPELFRAGVAVAPVVDWLDYDTHYTERFMGLPDDNPEGYASANVLTYASRLERPLLLVHGTADDNVYFTHSLKLVDALFRAGRYFEFLPLPGFTHLVPEPLATKRLYARMMDHFARNLAAE
jgi:dipeptidyl-peptidase-4